MSGHQWPLEGFVFFDGRCRCGLLEPEHGPVLQRLLERDPEFFELEFGLPPGPSEAQSAYVSLPEGKSYEDKFLLGIFRASELIGVIDVIRDYPRTGVWTFGTIFVDPGTRREGIGTAAVEGVQRQVARCGGDRLRGVASNRNLAALAFAAKLGYVASCEQPEAGDTVLELDLDA